MSFNFVNSRISTQSVPEDKREEFIAQFVGVYLAKHPLDSQGLVHVSMVRLDVDAIARHK